MSIPIAYGKTTSNSAKNALNSVLAIVPTNAVEVATKADIVSAILTIYSANRAYFHTVYAEPRRPLTMKCAMDITIAMTLPRAKPIMTYPTRNNVISSCVILFREKT